MSHSKLSFIVLIILNLIFINEKVYSGGKEISYKEVYNQLLNMKTDPLKSASVSGLTIKRDVAVFELESGTLNLCTSVNGKVCAAIFMGSGSFHYTPPSEVEKEQLNRFYEKNELNENFDFLFLIFADSTLNELESKLTFNPAEGSKAADNQIRKSIGYLDDEGREYFDTDLMYTFLENEINGTFYAHFNSMFFCIDPLKKEEVLLEKLTPGFFHREWEIINQFPASGKNAYSNFNIKERYNVTRYNINSSIENDLDFSASTDINFIPVIDKERWIHFYLYRELDVDSVLIDNRKSEFFRGDDNDELWICGNEAFTKDNQYSLKIFYHGNLLKRDDLNWISLKSADFWYPRTGYGQKKEYNLTFHYPAEYQFAASGEKISEKDSDDIATEVWKCGEPSINASFNLGLFDEYNEKKDSLPEVTVYVNRTGKTELRNYFAPQGILLKDDMEEQIGEEVINCCRLYENLYGKISPKHIYATPIPYFHGEAFPGLVHLSWVTYNGLDDDVEGMIFRAHEIAHQWWGIGVGFKTYHDQWLSEAFAEYSGLWFVQTLLKDNEDFFRILDKWKDQILSNRKYLIGSGQEAGPVWLGYRTQSSETEGDYDLIIYKKGAWVLHMLRNMLLDVKTMNEDKFKSLLHEFYMAYYNKDASTEDFKKICDKYCNEDMSWFFNEWIYGTKIPEYTFSYKTEKTPEGKYNITCRIKQENVPDNFKIYTILLLKFDDDKLARLKIKVTGHITEFTIPNVPMEPEEIIFNDLHSTLCEVDYEDWK